MKHSVVLATLLLAACGNSGAPVPTPTTKTPAVAERPKAAPATNLPGSTLVNPDFEQPVAADGGIPGWNQLQHAGPRSYAMSVDSEGAYAGRGSFHMVRTHANFYGSLTQMLDAKDYAGKTVELSAMLKAHGVGPGGWKLFINAQLPDTLKYSDGVTGDADWKRDAVRLEVPARATQLIVGVTLLDGGEGWMDDVALKVVN